MVIMNTSDYSKKIEAMLNEPIYKLQQQDLINRKEIEIPENTAEKFIPSASAPPRLYGLSKIHKESNPLRKVVNCIGSSTYLLESIWQD